MEKFLREFEDKSSYENEKGNINRPGVSLIEDTMEVMYDPILPTVKFTAEEANSTIGLEELSTNQTLEYSLNGYSWNNMDTTTNIVLDDVGDSVYVRGTLSGDNSEDDYTQFKMSGTISANGNINYIWNYQNPEAPLKAYCGFNMFFNCISLVSSPELPSTDLSPYCYAWLFQNTRITVAPELPAILLSEGCYYGMFFECTELVSTPTLSATVMKENCYSQMFQKCSSLTEVTDLPSTELAYYCYGKMFNGCTSLTQAPELPATTLSDWCYYQMFYKCTSLIQAPSVLPALNATQGCYSIMFKGCTSLIESPIIMTLDTKFLSHNGMFTSCTNLSKVTCMIADRSGNSCTNTWLKDVASEGVFYKNPAMNSWPRNNDGIPSNWMVQDAE